MNTLILSCNTGEGHNSSAKGIVDYYNSVGENCFTVDALSFVSKRFSKSISSAHVILYRYFPKINDFLYKLAEKNEDKLTDNFIGFKALSKGVINLYKFIVEGNYDTVICVHVFAAYMLNLAIKKHQLKIKTAFVCTDYSYIPTVNKTSFNYYFIPDEDIKAEFISKKIDCEKIVVSGIPVKSDFYQNENDFCVSSNKDDANKMKMLIVTGSFGCGPVKKILREILKIDDKRSAFITVVCGNNNKLKKSLSTKKFTSKNFSVLGFEKNMAKLISGVDLLITKPGGLSVTEAIIKKTPMLIYNAVSGCERANSKFLANKGMAKTVNNVKELKSELLKILRDKTYLNASKKALDNYKTVNSAKVIYDTLSLA